MTKRAKRLRQRDAPRSVVGSARDLELLRSLAWAGYLSTGQLRRLHFPSIRTAQRRLRALLDHGLVRAHLQGVALHLESVHALTPKGITRLELTGVRNLRLRRVPRVGKLAHGLASRDLFVAFVLAERAGACELGDFLFEEDLASEPSFRAAGIIPDALAIVRYDGQEVFVGWEVDLGTETTTTLRRKLGAWRRMLESRALGRLMLVLAVRRASRANTLRTLLEEVACPAILVCMGALTSTPVVSVRCLFVHPVRTERTLAPTNIVEFQVVGVSDGAAFRG